MTLQEETAVLKTATDELVREVTDWQMKALGGVTMLFHDAGGNLIATGIRRENGMIAVCAWCFPGFSGSNVTHTVCARHKAEIAAGVKGAA